MKNIKNEDLNFTISYILQQIPDSRTEEQLKTVAELFKMKKYLQDIDNIETIVKICKRIYVETFHKNQVIFTKGQKGDYFYIIMTGKVAGYNDFQNDDETIHHPYLFTLGPGKSFGEMAILSNSYRMCSMKAIDYSELIVISKEIYKQYYGVD